MPLNSLNNYPTWYREYGDSPTSSPASSRDIIYDAGYDPDRVLKDFGDSFEAYDPTREQFAQDRLENQEEAANLNFAIAEDQAEREEALIQAQVGDDGFLAQAWQRQKESLGIQKADAEAAQDRTSEARWLATNEVGIQRHLTMDEQRYTDREAEAQMGVQDPTTGEWSGGRLGLRREDITAASAADQARLADRRGALGTEESAAIRRAASQEAGVGREEERLALAEAGAGAESQFALGRLGREREELGLQAEQDVLAGERDLIAGREIGMERNISDIQRGQFGLRRDTSALEQREAQAGMDQLQAQMGQQVAGARRGMMQAYQAGEADTSGFAGAGARDVAQQRAIQGYAGDAAAGIQGLRAKGESLRRGMERFDIAGREIGLEEQAFNVGAGRFGLAEERLDLQKDARDISMSRRAIGEADIQAQETKEEDRLQRQLDQYDISASDLSAQRTDIQGELATQQEAYNRQLGPIDEITGKRTGGSIGRQIGERAAAETRQLKGVGFDLAMQETSFERKRGQLGAQLSGYGIQDSKNRLRFDEQAGRLRSQIAQNSLQQLGAEDAYNEQRGRAKSRLGAVEKQLGEGGFLQQGLSNQLDRLGGGFAEDVFGLRDQYGDEVRDRLIDLVRDQGLDDTYKDSVDKFEDEMDYGVERDEALDDTPGLDPFEEADTTTFRTTAQKQAALIDAGLTQEQINELMELPNWSELNIRQLIYKSAGR